VRRPKGAGGEKTTYSFSPAQAFPILEQLYAIEIELGVLCELLLYTGLRLGEALKLTIGDLDLGGARLIARKTKNGKARIAHLPPAAVAALRNHPRGLDRPADARLFRFHKGGSLTRLHHAAIAQAGLSAAFPERQGFHLWRHTYATWQAEINEMSAYDLVRTGAWSDPSSAERYNHASKSKQARGADNFPTRPHLRLVKEVA
jgi:integrase